MKGTVSSNQRCPECAGALKYIEGAGTLQYQKHPDVIWRLNCFVRFGRKHTKRFKSVVEAERHLTYLRAQTDHGSFDIRDWQKDVPLSFRSLRAKFLIAKKTEVISKKQLQHIEYVLDVAGKEWDHMSIKLIGEGEIEDFFIKDHGVGKKTLANWKGVLTNFWSWVVRREKKRSTLEMPEFPSINFKLAWRNIVSMEDQAAILNEVKRLTFQINPRLWLGIKLLSMYPRVRPGEMLNVKEGHVNLNENWILFPDPKEGVPKFIHLLDEHAELIRKIRGPKGLPGMYFFRHITAKPGVKAGVRFGQRQFRMWWNRACKNLGFEGIDLYGGTKHSTVTALGKVMTPEQIQRGATGHVSKVFRRYMLPDINEAILATQAVQKMQSESDPQLIHISGAKKLAK